MPGKLKDLTNLMFGKLTVIEFSHMNGRHSYWLCKCNCGNYHTVRSDCLKDGMVQSCGCLNHEHAIITHDQSGTRLYRVWASMKDRCSNKNNKHYDRYGERGIIVCEEWVTDYMAFYNYVSKLLQFDAKGMTLDRINNDGNYEPDNVRWVTQKVQNNNKTQRKTKEYYEKVKCNDYPEKEYTGY